MLTHQSHLFSIPEDITYLNMSYMSPQLKAVDAVGQQALVRKAQPWGITIDDFFEPLKRLRSAFAQLIEADGPDRIAVIPSVSYGLANVAKNAGIKTGDRIVILHEQFPSNVYSWQQAAEEAGAELITVAPPIERENRGAVWNARLLEAITPNTRVVALAHVHWADGTRFDIKAIRARTREVGALLVIDGTQSVGALPFSVKELQPDALICGGYKWLMGPYSLGVAYYGPAFDEGRPIEENWINRKGSEDFSRLVNYQPDYGPGAARYSVGEQSNFVLVPMLTTAIEQLLDWGVANIQAYTQHITAEAIPALRDLGCYIEDEAYRGHHLIGVHFPEGFPVEALKAYLTQEQVFVSYRGACMRVSPHLYNTPEHLQKLVAGFRMVGGKH